MEVGGREGLSFCSACGREGALLLFVGGGNRSEHTISSLSLSSIPLTLLPRVSTPLKPRGSRQVNKQMRESKRRTRRFSESTASILGSNIVAKTSCLPPTLVLIFYHRRCTLYICIASHLMMFPIKATLNYSPPFDATSYIKRGYTNSRGSQSASRRRNLRVRDLSRVRRRDVRTNTIEKTAHRLRELAITKPQSFILLCLFHSLDPLCSGQAPYGATWSICCCPPHSLACPRSSLVSGVDKCCS